jgi:hypothetical protein
VPVEARFPCNFPVFRRPISQILRLRRATLLVSFPFERGAREKDAFLRCARIRVLSQGNLNVCMCMWHITCCMWQHADAGHRHNLAECNFGHRMQRLGLNMLRKQMHRGPLHPWVRSTCLIDWLCHARACLVSGSPWLWPWAQNKQWRSLLRMH